MLNKLCFCAAGMLLVASAPTWVVAAEAANASGAVAITQEQAQAPDFISIAEKLREKLAPSLLEVAYTLQWTEEGEAPMLGGYYCENCHRMHPSSMTEKILIEQRKLLTPGYLIAPDQVIAPDILLESRDCKAIEVSFGKASTSATLEAYYPDQGAILLKLEKPLAGTQPLKFSGDYAQAQYCFFHADEDGVWLNTVRPFSIDSASFFLRSPRNFFTLPSNTLVVSASGEPITLLMNASQVSNAQSWQQVPADWKGISPQELEQRIETLKASLQQNVLPVRIAFQERKFSRSSMGNYRDRKEELEERDVLGLQLPEGEVLVFAGMPPSETALIESLTVKIGDQEYQGEFLSSLRDWNMFLMKLTPQEEGSAIPGSGIAVADVTSLLDHFGKMEIAVEPKVYGQKIKFECNFDRIEELTTGFQDTECISLRKSDENALIFTLDGKLLAMPGALRTVSGSERYRSDDTGPLINAKVFLTALANGEIEFDGNNIPQSGTPEEVGYLGIEYQMITPELAQETDISEPTKDGEIGLLISYVFPGSPAEKMGLKVNDVLLRIIPRNGKPINLGGYEFSSNQQQFPWEQLDQVPEEYFDEIPTPWPGMLDGINAILTEAGIGNSVELVALVDGKIKRFEYTVSASPTYFTTAPSYQANAMGLTVCDPTFEVMRYFRMTPKDSGVIISRVKAGSRASTAGLRPFEVITAVNDTEVHNVQEFSAAIKDQSEVKLNVKRMAVSRVVTVKMQAGPFAE